MLSNRYSSPKYHLATKTFCAWDHLVFESLIFLPKKSQTVAGPSLEVSKAGLDQAWSHLGWWNAHGRGETGQS